jgi:hypothetical protein
MKNWIALPLLLFVFVIGFFFLRAMCSFFKNSISLMDEDDVPETQKKIRITTEKAEYLDDLTEALTDCSRSMPAYSFRLYGASRDSLVRNLHSGRTDIALLENLPEENIVPKIPVRHSEREHFSVYGLPVTTEASDFYIVWDPSVSSKERDSVLQFFQRQSVLPVQVKKV